MGSSRDRSYPAISTDRYLLGKPLIGRSVGRSRSVEVGRGRSVGRSRSVEVGRGRLDGRLARVVEFPGWPGGSRMISQEEEMESVS